MVKDLSVITELGLWYLLPNNLRGYHHFKDGKKIRLGSFAQDHETG